MRRGRFSGCSPSEIGQCFDGRVTGGLDQVFSEEYAVPRIEIQQAGGGLPHVGERDDFGCSKPEVLIPAISARMTQANETRRTTDEGAGIGALGDVATQAGEGEMRSVGAAPLFSADTVINVERKTGIRLMNQAIFADSARTLNDEPTQTD